MLSLLMWTTLATAAPRTEVGAGLRDADGNEFDGGKALVAYYRVGNGAFTWELGFGYAPDRELDRVPDLVHTLVAISEYGSGDLSFQVPVHYEKASVQVLADWSFFERGRQPGWSGGPRLLGGAYLQSEQWYYAKYDNDTGRDDLRTMLVTGEKIPLVVGAVAGMSLDLWKDGKWGLRTCVLNRISLERYPQYDPNVVQTDSRLRQRIVLTFDVLYGLK